VDIPLQITWRGLASSAAVEADIRERAGKLESFYDHIVSCRVVVEAPHHQHQGNLFHVTIDIKVPGKEIVVGRGPAARQAHEDMYVALRDAFDAAKRQLQDYSRVRRGEVKQHDEHHVARVLRRLPAQGYGFLQTPDGREIYFHRNAVQNGDFDMLDEGTEVWFVEEQGEKGPQAKRVTIGKHNPGDV
jgi:cold shock CspA family protein/ribosome-associated translation inhibitor RaiA